MIGIRIRLERLEAGRRTLVQQHFIFAATDEEVNREVARRRERGEIADSDRVTCLRWLSSKEAAERGWV